MKKIITGLLLAATLALCVCGTAFAATNEERICELATSNEKVISAECVIYQRTCLIAIKTEKFTTKSAYDEYLDGLKTQIKSDFEIDNVIVTRNPKIMSKISKLREMSDEQRNAEIEKLIQRELNRIDNHKNIMPR
ncbi:MAG: YhcN/YlaJ family sporulation lipoprotein [Corallococcus sp.]|nr:YhcN/YlaJ family sporulation lipoprotein [Corallococcus sp.]